MEIQAVTAGTTDNQSTGGPLVPAKSLGKDDFLRLLMTQLRNQDPMAPLGNTEFIAQMAQFSSLEQMSNLAALAEEMGRNQRQAALVAQATALIGRTVTLEVPDASSQTNGSTIKVSGKVGSVRLEGGWPRLIIDGQPYDPAYVSEVA